MRLDPRIPRCATQPLSQSLELCSGVITDRLLEHSHGRVERRQQRGLYFHESEARSPVQSTSTSLGYRSELRLESTLYAVHVPGDPEI